ncbi:tyrosine-protein phosphatase [Nocardia sp. A7]|uniref:tyrosine-protein phosphatase n=1 Tax=Nocardia sp. A7 TaxID=2789274 RepID=UPI00397DC255
MPVSWRRSTTVLALCGGLLTSPILGANLTAAGAAPTTGSSDFAQFADTPRLGSVDNFRDVAGTGAGYINQDGHHVARGAFYRSNAVTPDDIDWATLSLLGLRNVYDLRSASEITAKADRLPLGANYLNIPIMSGDLGQTFRVSTAEQARELLREANRSFVTGAFERAGFATLLTQLAQQPGPAVFHCTAGKDRTGWATYLLLSLAGVDRETIIADYLLTNEYSAASISATIAQMEKTRGAEFAAAYAPLMGVEREFLEAGIDELALSYGSVDNYLRAGLGLSETTIEQLRTKLVR